MRKVWLAALSLFLVFTSPPSFADPGAFSFVQEAFNTGKYEAALQRLQASPQENAAYFYNLGTVLLKLQRIGPASAYLEKANRLQPHDVAIQQNLQIARSELVQALGPEKLDPASSWIETLAENLRMDEIRGAFGLVSFIIAFFWIRSYLKTRRLRETLMKPAGLLGLGALAITASLYGMERISADSPLAICLEKTSIRSGPGPAYVEVAQASAGVKLRALGPTLETSEQKTETAEPSPTPSSSALGATATAPTVAATEQLWRQIRYSSDGIGWIRASSVLLL